MPGRSVVGGAEQIADEQNASGRDHAVHLRENSCRLGNVVNDAVGNDGAETRGGEEKVLGVTALQVNEFLQARPVHIFPANEEHLRGQVDPDDSRMGGSTAQLKWDLGGTGAHVKNGILTIPDGEEIGNEGAIDRTVVHGVVVTRLLGRIHHFRLEDAREHEEVD